MLRSLLYTLHSTWYSIICSACSLRSILSELCMDVSSSCRAYQLIAVCQPSPMSQCVQVVPLPNGRTPPHRPSVQIPPGKITGTPFYKILERISMKQCVTITIIICQVSHLAITAYLVSPVGWKAHWIPWIPNLQLLHRVAMLYSQILGPKIFKSTNIICIHLSSSGHHLPFSTMPDVLSRVPWVEEFHGQLQGPYL